jgi:hypothetical protein
MLFKFDDICGARGVVVPKGVEPLTFGLGNRCSILLSYGTTACANNMARRSVPARVWPQAAGRCDHDRGQAIDRARGITDMWTIGFATP